jgi:hypothetical protein
MDKQHEVNDKLQASTGGRKHINTKEVNKQNKAEERYIRT